MAEQFLFPQNGDAPDAESFATLIGQDNLSDYVERGLTFSVDYSTPSVTVSTGKVYISRNTITTDRNGETRLTANYAIQLPQITESLVSSDVNHIYVTPNFGTNDSPTITSYTSTGNASSTEFKIGEVDTANQTKTLVNREPALSAKTLTFGLNDDFIFDYDESTSQLVLDDGNGLRSLNIDKNGNLEVPNGSSIVDAISPSSAANLALRGDGSGSGGVQITHGDGTTIADFHESGDVDVSSGTLSVDSPNTVLADWYSSGTKQAEIDSSGNINTAGTLTENSSL